MLETTARRWNAVVRAGKLAAAFCAAGMLAACAAKEPESSSLASANDDGAERELVARGELLSFACRPCHGLAPGDESPLGPHLHGVFGRPAAQVAGFQYSPALRESGIVWTDETLDQWLAQPDTFLPGNDMAFTGFRSAADRRALIAYLKEQTGGTAPPDDDRALEPSGPGTQTSAPGAGSAAALEDADGASD